MRMYEGSSAVAPRCRAAVTHQSDEAAAQARNQAASPSHARLCGSSILTPLASSEQRSSLEDDLGTLEVEAEAHLAQARLRHRPPQTHLLLGVEHQEATAAGTDQLAAQRPVRLRQLVPLVDPVVAHRTAALLLVFPVDVHQLGEAHQVAGLHRFLALVAQLLDEVQVVHHRLVALLAPVVLLLEDARRRAAVAGEEQEQVVFKVVERFRADLQRPCLDMTVGQELEARQPAERGNVLVLLADWLPEPVQLDVAGLFGQLARMDEVLVVRVQRLQECRRETARRAQAGAGRDVGHAGDLQARPVHAGQLERFTDNWMLNLVNIGDTLELGILDDQLWDKGVVQGDANILVDGRGEQEAGVLLIVRRQVSAATAQRDSQRAACDDHPANLPSVLPSRCWGEGERTGRAYTCPTMSSAARASSSVPSGCRPDSTQWTKWANSSRQEPSSPGYSQMIVSGGPICGSRR